MSDPTLSLDTVISLAVESEAGEMRLGRVEHIALTHWGMTISGKVPGEGLTIDTVHYRYGNLWRKAPVDRAFVGVGDWLCVTISVTLLSDG